MFNIFRLSFILVPFGTLKTIYPSLNKPDPGKVRGIQSFTEVYVFGIRVAKIHTD